MAGLASQVPGKEIIRKGSHRCLICEEVDDDSELQSDLCLRPRNSCYFYASRTCPPEVVGTLTRLLLMSRGSSPLRIANKGSCG